MSVDARLSSGQQHRLGETALPHNSRLHNELDGLDSDAADRALEGLEKCVCLPIAFAVFTTPVAIESLPLPPHLSHCRHTSPTAATPFPLDANCF